MKHSNQVTWMRTVLFLVIFSFSFCLPMGFMSIDAEAEEEPAPIQDLYTIDGVNYYNTGSQNFARNSNQYLKDVLSAGSSELDWKGYNRSMADLWLETAAGLLYGKDYLSDGRFTVAMDMAACQNSNYVSYYLGDQHVDVSRYPINNMKSDDMKSLKSAEQYVYRVAGINKDQGSTGYFKDKDTEQSVVVGAMKATNDSGDYRVAAVYFTNFKMVPLFPKDEGNNFVTTIIKDDTEYSDQAAAGVRNNTATTANGSQKVSNSYSVAMSSSISGSKSYSLQESVSVSNEFAAGFFNKFKLDISITASQTIQEGWSKSESVTEQKGTEQNISVTLPPYTNVMMTQKTTKADYLTRYNCPVGITFDVNIVIYDRNGIHADAINGSPLVFKYASTARTALKNRYEEYKGESSLFDPDGVRWYSVTAFDYDFTHIEEAIGKTTTFIPMAPTGAEFRQTVNLVSGEITGVMPIYPLTKVKLESLSIPVYNNNGSYNSYNYLDMKMPVGDTTYTWYLSVAGYNQYDVPYFGFSGSFGSWKVVDEKGDELTGEDAPIVIGKENVSGYSVIKAVKPGVCYLKYFIDEDVYTTASDPDHYTTNDELSRTAVIKVTVPDDRSISVSGKYQGYVDEDPEALDADGKLYAAVCDATGVETDQEVTWEKKERNNIILEDNMISFTKPGTYHVRACADGLKSDWIEITAKYRTFNVKFVPQNGKKENTVAVRKGEKVGKPSVTSTKCTKFKGWFEDKAGKKAYDFSKPVVKDITLYGSWTTSHVWNKKYTTDKAATYKAAGSKSIHCSVCNTIKKGSKTVIPKKKVKPTIIIKLKPAKKGFTAKWKKVAGINGYELQYARNKKFTSRKKVKINKAGTTKKKVTKLKAKKKYFVRIRTFKKVGGKKYYSGWSKPKRVKIK